ncbi:hypothetical protein [Hymenobacter elongatus]|uniref:DUF3828 domain-containing protein n=1 Tax=Hymenobacter elongatus TaxID=877208 RepID=A0A4Z0PG30_9BACT|nr:hypothetical protein [Hymenobacter elongatus]TGE14071.1 hypothetical protein E5J99_17610 [Hymenobacter elongatus]
MRKYLILFLAAAPTACTSPADQPAKVERPVPVPEPTTVASSTAGPDQTVRQFVDWYLAKWETLPTDFLLNDDGQDSTMFYAVNFPGTEIWLREVQKSGTVSSTYLAGWRTYFRRYADTLQLHPQNDGPPAGFDYDFLMLSQEADARAAELKVGTLVVTRRQGRRAQVQARGPRHENWQEGLDFELTQAADGRWLIDKITPGGSDL